MRTVGNPALRRWTQIERADRIEPVEVMQEFAGRSLCRHGSQSVQSGKAGLAGFVEQLCNPLTLFLIESGNKTFPKALLRPVPDAADKAFKDADVGQKHLVYDQPGRGALDQRPEMIVATPAQRVKPPRQAKLAGPLSEALYGYTADSAETRKKSQTRCSQQMPRLVQRLQHHDIDLLARVCAGKLVQLVR
jgi:hypothetical protein